jgi:hypothetical protein
MTALAPFDVCVTLCFTPPSRGIRSCHTSPPNDVGEFATFTENVLERYAAVPAPSPAVGLPGEQ